MTWTYDPGLPTDRDWVRLKIGDTDTADQILSDEEIDALLEDASSKEWAARDAVDAILSRFARSVDRSMGDLSVSLSSKFDHFEKLAVKLEAQAKRRSALSGIPLYEPASGADPRDPIFGVGMMDHPSVIDPLEPDEFSETGIDGGDF